MLTIRQIIFSEWIRSYIFVDRIYRINRIFFLQRFPEESAETQSACRRKTLYLNNTLSRYHSKLTMIARFLEAERCDFAGGDEILALSSLTKLTIFGLHQLL